MKQNNRRYSCTLLFQDVKCLQVQKGSTESATEIQTNKLIIKSEFHRDFIPFGLRSTGISYYRDFGITTRKSQFW